MKCLGLLLAPILVVALAGCSSGGAAAPTASDATDGPTSAADRPVEPRPAAAGTLAYILDGSVYVADMDGSNAVKIADGRGDDDCGSTDGFSFWAEGSMWSPDGRYLAYRRVDCSVKEPGIGENWWDVVISDAAGNVHAAFPADGWDIGWSPDSSHVAVWDVFDYEGPSTVGVYGLDGARQAQIAMPSDWRPSGDHDPAWLSDGTLAVDDVKLPLDGGAAGWLDAAQSDESWEGYIASNGWRATSPDGSHTARVDGRSMIVEGSDGSGSVTLLTVERGTSLGVIGFSPEGHRILFRETEDPPGRRSPSLWSIRVDGSDPRLIVAGTTEGDWFAPSVALESLSALSKDEPSPAPTPTPASVIGFSPQGDRILFSKRPPGQGAGGLWSIGVDDSDPRLVVEGTGRGAWLSP